MKVKGQGKEERSNHAKEDMISKKKTKKRIVAEKEEEEKGKREKKNEGRKIAEIEVEVFNCEKSRTKIEISEGK